jgi:anaphase-promoting complex subunit 2
LLDFNNNSRVGSDVVDDSREEMQVYWSYIQGMLTNLGAVNAEKIHSFLKMLVPKETPYVKTLDELKVLLEFMVEEEKLVVKDDGLYKLH